MRVLSVDTSSPCGSVALVLASADLWHYELIAEATSRVSNTHGESVLPVLDWVLGRANLTLADIDLLAVGVGPGSFTGTRIGVSLMKGLAVGAGKPLRGVTSFEALAMRAAGPPGSEVTVAIDARKQEIYLSVLLVGQADLETVRSPRHLAPHLVMVEGGVSPMSAVTGNGAPLVAALARRVGPLAHADAPHAAMVGALAGARQLHAPVDEVDTLEPLYVRPPDITVPQRIPGMPR